MNREKKLIKNTIIMTIGRISTQFISFFLLPLYTALLSTEEYGIVDLITTYTTLLVPIVILEIEQGVFRFLIDAREKEEEKKIIITTTISISIIQSIVFILLYSIMAQFINSEYKYFLGVNVIVNSLSSIMLQISRGLGDNFTYTLGSCIVSISSIIFNIIFIVGFKLGAYGMLIASIIANIICSIFIIIRKRIYNYFKCNKFRKNTLFELWRYSLPLVPSATSWWIMNASDRIIISQVLNTGANGIYAVANKLSSIFTTFSSIFGMAWTETASLHINDKDSSEFFSSIINSALKIFSTACLGIIAYMPLIYPILINEKFDEAYYHIPILMLATLFNCFTGLISVVYVARKKTKEETKTTLIASVINLIVNILWINKIGLYAASISTVIAYFSVLIFRMIHVQKYIKIKFDWKMIIQTVIWLIVLFYTYYLKNSIVNILIMIIITIYAILINKDWINLIIKKIERKIREVIEDVKKDKV